jgi:hypothetical protein
MWCTLWRHINRTSQRTTTRIVFTCCDENQYYSEIWKRSCSYNPTARQSDIPIVRQFDSPTEMCLFFTFTVQVRKKQSKNSRERYKVLVWLIFLNIGSNLYTCMTEFNSKLSENSNEKGPNILPRPGIRSRTLLFRSAHI